MTANTRKPIVSGSFYPSSKEELEAELEEYLCKKKESIKAVISPHAGFMFSGKLAGDVLGRFENRKDFVILGVNHSGLGSKISFSQQDFETPLGIIKNNQALSNKLLKDLKKAGFDAEINEQAHEREHSIEVQLPFLQQSQKSFSIIPILLKNLSLEECKKFAQTIECYVDENIGLIVSSDFTHYGPSYNFTPFKSNIKKHLYDLDNEIIINILNENSKKVYELAKASTVCGLYGITILTELAKIKGWKAKLLEYYTSGDIIGDWNNSVGYAGISFG